MNKLIQKRKCAILSCKSHLIQQEYTYFKIPDEKHAERKKLWLNALNIMDEDLKKTKKKTHFVCSLHFKPAELGFGKFLKMSTIPSLFPNVQSNEKPSDSNINDFVEENESTHHPQPMKSTMSDLCRICLGTSDNFVSFNAKLDFTCQTVSEVVNYVTNVDIDEEEDQFNVLPQHVCHNCIEQLRIGFNIKKLAHESNNCLKDYLKISTSNTDLDEIEEMETTSDPLANGKDENQRKFKGPLNMNQEMETTSDPLVKQEYYGEYSITHSRNHSSDKDENEKRTFEGSLTPSARTYIEKLILESENRSMAVINRQASIIADFKASFLNVPSSSSVPPDLHYPTSISAPKLQVNVRQRSKAKRACTRKNE